MTASGRRSMRSTIRRAIYIRRQRKDSSARRAYGRLGDMTTDAISRPHQNSITAASFSQRLMLLMLPVDLFRALPNMVAIFRATFAEGGRSGYGFLTRSCHPE